MRKHQSAYAPGFETLRTRRNKRRSFRRSTSPNCSDEFSEQMRIWNELASEYLELQKMRNQLAKEELRRMTEELEQQRAGHPIFSVRTLQQSWPYVYPVIVASGLMLLGALLFLSFGYALNSYVLPHLFG